MKTSTGCSDDKCHRFAGVCIAHTGEHMSRTTLGASAVRDVVVKRTAQAHVTTLSPHDVRRTVAGNVLDNDVDLVTVQKLLGHASVQTTASYDRRGERAKKKVVGTLHVPYV